jgi:hypothetical protein
MPGADDREHKIPVRRFTGTIVAMDPAFVPAGFLVACDNWVPDPTYVLTKRRGSEAWQTIPGAVDYIDRLGFNLGSDGHRYLFAMACMVTGPDTLFVSVDDGTFTAVANGTFATTALRYGFVAIGDTVYIGNDADPIKYVHLGDPAVDVVQLGLADDTGQTATTLDDPNSNLIAGTYSYRWAVMDTTTQRWVKIANVRSINTPAASRVRLQFRPPTGGVTAGQNWHLFVAGADQMIEGAHDQLPSGVAAGSSDIFALYDDPTVDTTSVPIPSTVQRRGSHLIAHRGCLYGAGGPGAEGNRVWATGVLVPGLEQQNRDQALFYPATALTRDLGDTVTGLAVVPQSSAVAVPTAPLAIFTAVSAWMWMGDLSSDDPTASLAQVSAEIGCPSDRTIVPTIVGVIFCGKRSVYLMQPSTQEPTDIGWPIESAIRSIPADARDASFAVFHRGFYKLAITPPGAAFPSQQWWLDLRHGLGDPPAWWGPHTTPAYSASVRDQNHPAEDDRQWAALGAGQILLLDQASTYVEDGSPPVPIVSRAVTSYLDDGTPLVPKLAKRARIIARVGADTSVTVSISGDEALSTTGVLPFKAPPSAQWDIDDWNVAQWSISGLDLEEMELPVPELRARAFQATLTHSDPISVDLRDFELRVQPSARETR